MKTYLFFFQIKIKSIDSSLDQDEPIDLPAVVLCHRTIKIFEICNFFNGGNFHMKPILLETTEESQVHSGAKELRGALTGHHHAQWLLSGAAACF